MKALLVYCGQNAVLTVPLCFPAQCAVLLLIESLYQICLMQTVRIHLMMDLFHITAVESYIPVRFNLYKTCYMSPRGAAASMVYTLFPSLPECTCPRPRFIPEFYT